MKFIYVDESGDRDQGDVFVMAGLMIDAYKLRKKTADFDAKLQAIFELHPGTRGDLKTSRFINGRGAWGDIDPEERKTLLREICELAVANGGRVFAIALSFEKFDEIKAAGHGQPFDDSYWIAAAMFVSALVQKKMQSIANSKGLTVLIMDDHKREMSRLSENLYTASDWFDALYQQRGRHRGKPVWLDRTEANRFDQIINTAFAIKSDHSSLVQVADAISFVIKRSLELQSADEAYEGERAYYEGLMTILEPRREKLGICRDAPCRTFYEGAAHPAWPI